MTVDFQFLAAKPVKDLKIKRCWWCKKLLPKNHKGATCGDYNCKWEYDHHYD